MANCKKRAMIKYGVSILATALTLAFFQSTAWAVSKSSCETCHLDEDLLTETLTIDTSVGSAMQSGSG